MENKNRDFLVRISQDRNHDLC